MIEQVVLYLISFLIFIFLQGLAINGIYEAFHGGCIQDMEKGKICKGNILYSISPSFFERHKDKYWSKCCYTCVKCMASLYGGITFWGTVLPLFGFHWFEILVYIFDVFILCSLNWWIYKKL